MEKSTLRKHCQEMRKETPEIKIRESGVLIGSNIISKLDIASYDTFLFYHPLRGEVSLLSLAEQLLSVDKQVAFPRVRERDMDFYCVTDLKSQFSEGSFHVMEPVTETKADLTRAVCFVPGLAFDSQFQRLGYGAGYYDRYFAAHPQIMRIGICMNRFYIPVIPAQSNDVSMHWIVTENHVYKNAV